MRSAGSATDHGASASPSAVDLTVLYGAVKRSRPEIEGNNFTASIEFDLLEDTTMPNSIVAVNSLKY
jgi:hypothetical protein